MYLCHHTNSIDDITAIICMISLQVYGRQIIHYIYDIIQTMYDNTKLCVDYTTLGICMTSFVLQKTSHPLYHTKPKSLWLQIHFRHDITPCIRYHSNCIIVITTSPLISHPHFITSHPLYLWHHRHYIYNHIHCLCHQTILLMTAQPWHMKPCPICSSKYTLSVWHHSH